MFYIILKLLYYVYDSCKDYNILCNPSDKLKMKETFLQFHYIF